MTPSRGTTIRTVRVNPDLWDAARTKAVAAGESVSDVIRRALEAYVTE